MERLSLALFPHKGIRNMFSQFLVAAGNTDYPNKEKVKTLYDAGVFFFKMLAAHSVDENTVVLRELEKKIPGSSAHDMAEHEEIETEQAKLEKMLEEIYNKSQAGEDESALGFKFYFELSRFQRLYFMHMIGEETETQDMLWKHFTDEDLVAMRTEIIANMKPGFFLEWCNFLIPALTPQERTLILGGIKANAPADSFEKIMAVAKKCLHAEDYNAIVNKLN
jgi:hypothetical protein